MRKSFFNNSIATGAVICILTTFSFFLPNLLLGKIPQPADSLLGLYHPFRDASYNGYNPGKFPVKNPLITDPVLQTFPWRQLAVENLKNWQMPFFNPYSFSGQPLMGNVQSAAFSPVNILFLVSSFKIGWGAQVILPSLLTTLFTFLFLTSLKISGTRLSTLSAAFGSLTLTYSGFFVAWLEWGTIITTAMWLPLCLLCLNKLGGKTAKIYFLLLVIALAASFLSGHLQTYLYLVLAFLFYAFYQSASQRRPYHFGLALLALVLALTITSPQLATSAEFITNSARVSDQGYYSGRQDWFIPLQHLIQVIVPDYFGNPTTYNYWGVWNYAEFVSFIGLVPFYFALLAIFSKSKTARSFALLLVISLTLGTKNPLSQLPYSLNLPFVATMQPSRIIFLVDFCLAILSAIGLDLLLASKRKRLMWLCVVIVSAVIVTAAASAFLYGKSFPAPQNLDPQKIALKNIVLPTLMLMALIVVFIGTQLKIKRSYIIAVIFALTVFDLFRFGYKFLPFTKLEWIYPPTQITDYLSKQPRPFRVVATDRRILHPNISNYYRIESVDGYDPLYLKTYGQLVASWQSNHYQETTPSFNRIVTPQNITSPILNLLNVRYILTFDELKNPSFIKILETGNTKLYENTKALPRAFFIEEVIKAGNAASFENIISKDFNFRQKAYSEDLSFSLVQSNGELHIKSYNDNEIIISSESQTEKPAVITNIYDRNWKVFVDGKPANLFKANVFFQGVLVPAGNHELKLIYKPDIFYKFIPVSITGIIGAVLVFFLRWPKRFQS